MPPQKRKAQNEQAVQRKLKSAHVYHKRRKAFGGVFLAVKARARNPRHKHSPYRRRKSVKISLDRSYHAEHGNRARCGDYPQNRRRYIKYKSLREGRHRHPQRKKENLLKQLSVFIPEIRLYFCGSFYDGVFVKHYDKPRQRVDRNQRVKPHSHRQRRYGKRHHKQSVNKIRRFELNKFFVRDEYAVKRQKRQVNHVERRGYDINRLKLLHLLRRKTRIYARQKKIQHRQDGENHRVDYTVKFINDASKIVHRFLIARGVISRNIARRRRTQPEIHQKQRDKRVGKRIKTVLILSDFFYHPRREKQPRQQIYYY